MNKKIEDVKFVPLKKLLAEDNEEIKKLRTIYQREEEYADVLGPIEFMIAHYYLAYPKTTDENIIRVIKNVRANYDKDIIFFEDELEGNLMGTISASLQDRKKKLTKHELFLVLGYVLWAIDNRTITGDSQGYLNWMANFFGLLNDDKQKKLYESYEQLGELLDLDKDVVKAMGGGEVDYELPVQEETLNVKDSEKFSDYSDYSEESISDLCSEQGTGFEVINNNNREVFYPILFAIEEAIFLEYSKDNAKEDNDVVDSLKRIRDNLFDDKFQFNALESAIIKKIKAALLLNDYNKKDVTLSISHILQSVKLHRFADGKKGYLRFNSEFFNQVEEEDELDEDLEEDGLWSKGEYIKQINLNDPDYEERMKYFEEKADEKKEHNCKKCDKKIGKHNLYWHEGMCNDCFFDEYGM